MLSCGESRKRAVVYIPCSLGVATAPQIGRGNDDLLLSVP